MKRRRYPLLIALLALPGLLGQQAIPVIHEHDGGLHPHHHAGLEGHFGCGHTHDDDAQQGAPAGQGDPSEQGRCPDDGEPHGHYRHAQTAALRRMALGAGGSAELRGVLLSRLVVAHEQLGNETIGQPPSPGEGRGWLRPRAGRTIDRLVQGIGLLL